MKKLAFILVLLACSMMCTSQRLAKYSIGNSGCALYMFCDPGEFNVAMSQDSSKVYTAECEQESVTYGVICIRLLNSYDDPDNAQEAVVSYLDFLKKNFNIKKAAGYGKGNLLNNNAGTRGVTDYWEDTDKNNWKVKAWTDGKFIGVLYAFSKTELNETKVNVFLNSFKMPGM